MYAVQLEEKLRQAQATICVLGLGYVGLPLLTSFYEAGFAVLGFERDFAKIKALEQGQSYIQDVSSERVAAMVQDERAQFSGDPQALKSADVLIICVPTPLHKSKEPDLSYILGATELIAEHARPGQLVVLESTTYPGTTDEMLVPSFEAQGLQIGADFFLAFSPERIDPGNAQYQVQDIPKVVGGITANCTHLSTLLYGQVMSKVHAVSSARVAETAKILENTFRSVNIALVNEFSQICRTLKVDVWEVIEAAATKPFGYMRFVPGPGIGGHCIPLDPHYLIWKSRLHGFEPRFMALADQINTAMPQVVVNLIMESLNEDGKALKGARIFVMGVAYKADVNDARESPAQHIFPLLHHKGAQLSFYDPYVSEFAVDELRFSAHEPEAEFLQQQDLVLILTDHSQVDYTVIAEHAPLIVDTRNAMRSFSQARVVFL